MTPLEKMAERARREPFFLGWLLEQYAAPEQLDDVALAAELGCTLVDLRRLRLCRAPRTDAAGLLADIRHLADALGLDADRLARVIRRATVQVRFQGSAGFLMAARDRDEEAE
jgi:hypothetical protein